MKLGRNSSPPIDSKGVVYRAMFAQSLDPLGAPPETCMCWMYATESILGDDWDVLGNDEIGNCTCADCSHQVMLWTANTGKIVKPTKQETIDLYSAITGYDPEHPETDKGANLLDVCGYLKRTGFQGDKTLHYAQIQKNSIDHIKWGVRLFGSVKLGVRMPANAQSQFKSGKAWDVGFWPQRIMGGHDVPIVAYDKDCVYVVTWGKIQAITYAWLNKYLEEVFVTLDPDWLRQAGTAPSGYNGDKLFSNMRHLEET